MAIKRVLLISKHSFHVVCKRCMRVVGIEQRWWESAESWRSCVVWQWLRKASRGGVENWGTRSGGCTDYSCMADVRRKHRSQWRWRREWGGQDFGMPCWTWGWSTPEACGLLARWWAIMGEEAGPAHSVMKLLWRDLSWTTSYLSIRKQLVWSLGRWWSYQGIWNSSFFSNFMFFNFRLWFFPHVDSSFLPLYLC